MTPDMTAEVCELLTQRRCHYPTPERTGRDGRGDRRVGVGWPSASRVARVPTLRRPSEPGADLTRISALFTRRAAGEADLRTYFAV